MALFLSHKAIVPTMYKTISLNEYVAVIEVKYFNIWRRKIKSNLYAESGIDKLKPVNVYQQDGITWVTLNSETKRKISEEGYFQKSIVCWFVAFDANEEKTFRLILMKEKPPIPCLLTGAFCGRNVEPSLHKVFIAYASKPKHFKKGVFKKKINQILTTLGFTAVLWEDKTQTGHFDCKICQDIQESFFTLFEFSEKRLNIAFELGFSIGIDKKYFIIRKRKGEALPADIRDLDQIEFDTYKELSRKLTKRIRDRYSIIIELS